MMRQPRDGTTVQELYRILTSAVAFLLGNTVEVSAAASTAVQSARHGLGRAYRGGWVTSGPNQALYMRILAPEGQAEPETYVYFQLSAATACTAKLWCF
jgi:hypothetical protein